MTEHELAEVIDRVIERVRKAGDEVEQHAKTQYVPASAKTGVGYTNTVVRLTLEAFAQELRR